MNKFLHYRAFDESQVNAVNPSGICARMGATVAYRAVDDNNTEFAVAYCHPRDNYVKAQGRIKATAHLDNKTERYDSTDAVGSDFIKQMDSVMFNDYGYIRA